MTIDFDKFYITDDIEPTSESMMKTMNKSTKDEMLEVIRSLEGSDFKEFSVPKNMYYHHIEYKDNHPIAFILAEKHKEKGKDVVDLSVAVNPEYRGQGIAYRLSSKAITHLQKDKSLYCIYWGAKKDNLASISLAKRLNMVYDSDMGDYAIYKKQLKKT